MVVTALLYFFLFCLVVYGVQWMTTQRLITEEGFTSTEKDKDTEDDKVVIRNDRLYDAFYAGIERGITIEKQRHISAITNSPNLEKLKEMKELLD